MSLPRNILKFAAVAAMAVAGTAHAATEIQWWHAMEGALNEKVNDIANKFNASQSEYKVVPVNKGNYDETMAAGIAAFRAGSAPAILQVFEVGTATMMSAKGAIKPVSTVMKDAGEKFDQSAYIPAVAGYYTSSKGEMLSFPFNSSTTVFYYNKDAFKKAGLDHPPKTWPEVMQFSAKLKASGQNCAYTTDWQGWVHLESFSAWHNTLYATKNNGFGGTDARLAFNSPLHVKHISNLQDMVKKGYFSYGGRKAESQAKFYNGECAMFTGSSASLANIRRNAKFQFGVSTLPYYPDVQGAPQNTIIGGASLWVMGGKKPEEYKGVAKFFTYLSRPEVQSEWHQATGYLPVTMAAYELTKKSGFYDKNPGADVSVQQMVVKTTDKSRGVRLGNLVQIRTVVDEELESVWAGKKEPQAALDNAVKRGNELLERFQKTVKE
ncbi:sn-glycerol-3-phosphate ABC transporter substrate-binding protein UgpB [Cupriavidus plantarum]|uniref:sn-glycerol-3-phosphate-binding periplasmic protein UgpB n=1 Tax=Cupriavidus plantarum TaxID=942865 RepID=A0A316EXA2_9BURK|nr:sn-glycerol-3-phosphate ABC transporter substrate-binding protein UgpB [Cupriavidus plantarum]NYH99782.1 sn-glycerol 3-phosphate transport system substrate-binding protein [Cupriavidus plantarum]PWK36981.1 glycerol 3-phosphate-binding protein [Cupriavidus plantarum]RLK44864.1 glycerol 3-phosphate-binding protein [Cupriavidus plantarum]CAG2152231.1 sn-glycerol-3-phosphate-binding periplasmic protein UgpB [Cupriavidus plantarum]SMR66064.1 glycerol 3-phosphate-binding protein [Cupriavidus plan